MDALEPGPGHGETERAAGEAEQHTLADDLAHDLPARGAERSPHRQLLAAADEARDEQVHHVGAGEHQQKADDQRQERKDQPGVGAGNRLPRVADTGLPAAIDVGLLALQAIGDGRHLDVRVVQRRAVAETTDRPPAALGAGAGHWVSACGIHTSISETLPSSMSGASTPTIV